ncbi:MAG: trigger factor [Bacilli bacterium]|nr:trigger factor [Bacilli bacterium]
MVKVERLSENRVKLVVTVSAEQFDLALDAAFEKVVKDIKVDGFRPGKLPKSIYISRFGWESLYNEAIEFAFQGTYPMALREANVYPVDDPKVDLVDPAAIEKGKSFDYTVEVDVWPNVHLGEYKGVKVKKQSTRVLKKDVEAYINNVLKGKAENVIKEGEASLGDTVVIDFEGFIDGVAFEGGKGENYSLELGSNSFVPGFEEQLVGAKSEDNVEVKVTFPENYHGDLASKEAVFKCVVHEVKTKVVPVLDEEFVKELELENVNTVEEYQEYVKKLLKDQKVAAAEQQFEADCIEAVLKNSYAEFPQSLINQGVEREIQRVAAQAKQYGLEAEMLLQYYGFANLDDFKKASEENVRKEFLRELVFEEIIKLEGITCTPEELEAKYLEIAGGDQSKVKQVKKQYSEAQVAFHINSFKVVDLIKANAVTK